MTQINVLLVLARVNQVHCNLIYERKIWVCNEYS